MRRNQNIHTDKINQGHLVTRRSDGNHPHGMWIRITVPCTLTEHISTHTSLTVLNSQIVDMREIYEKSTQRTQYSSAQCWTISIGPRGIRSRTTLFSLLKQKRRRRQSMGKRKRGVKSTAKSAQQHIADTYLDDSQTSLDSISRMFGFLQADNHPQTDGSCFVMSTPSEEEGDELALQLDACVSPLRCSSSNRSPAFSRYEGLVAFPEGRAGT